MAQTTKQLFSRQHALLASGIPAAVDSVAVAALGAATYTVPANTGIIWLSTDVKCLFRDTLGNTVPATLPVAGDTDGEESAWLHPGESRPFRCSPGQVLGFHGDGNSNSIVTIERYAGTNASLPPD